MVDTSPDFRPSRRGGRQRSTQCSHPRPRRPDPRHRRRARLLIRTTAAERPPTWTPHTHATRCAASATSSRARAAIRPSATITSCRPWRGLGHRWAVRTDPGRQLRPGSRRRSLGGLPLRVCGLFQRRRRPAARSFRALAGVKVWIVDALRYTPHPTHAHLARTLDWIARVAPERAILTNLHIDMDYRDWPPSFPGSRAGLRRPVDPVGLSDHRSPKSSPLPSGWRQEAGRDCRMRPKSGTSH